MSESATTKGKGSRRPRRDVYDIAVIGNRGTGKTSLIASMFSMFNDESALHRLRLEATDPRSRTYLNNSLAALREISSQLVVHEAGIGANPLEFKDLVFDLRRGTSPGHARIRFTDYPGEWTAVDDRLRKRVGGSPAVIVAIDAPAVMWDHGKLNARWNAPDLIQAALSDWLDDDSTSKRLVMFCPVKCESWVQDETSQQLLKHEVERQFSAALGLLVSSPRTTVIYSPLQTTGSLRHNRFDLLDDGGWQSKFLGTPGGYYSPLWVLNPLIASLAAVGDEKVKDQTLGDWFLRRNAELKKAVKHFYKRELEGPAEVWQAGD